MNILLQRIVHSFLFTGLVGNVDDLDYAESVGRSAGWDARRSASRLWSFERLLNWDELADDEIPGDIRPFRTQAWRCWWPCRHSRLFRPWRHPVQCTCSSEEEIRRTMAQECIISFTHRGLASLLQQRSVCVIFYRLSSRCPAETWSLTESLQNKVDAFNHQWLRRTLRISYRDQFAKLNSDVCQVAYQLPAHQTHTSVQVLVVSNFTYRLSTLRKMWITTKIKVPTDIILWYGVMLSVQATAVQFLGFCY